MSRVRVPSLTLSNQPVALKFQGHRLFSVPREAGGWTSTPSTPRASTSSPCRSRTPPRRPPPSPTPPFPWQGRGYATEAARALVAHLGQGPVSTVIAHIHPDHHASAAVARAAGMEPTEEQQDGETRWRLSLRPGRGRQLP
nr:GNAT family N-acetyltransferase [Streptomyces sp. VMFN-G11Ma]